MKTSDHAKTSDSAATGHNSREEATAFMPKDEQKLSVSTVKKRLSGIASALHNGAAADSDDSCCTAGQSNEPRSNMDSSF